MRIHLSDGSLTDLDESTLRFRHVRAEDPELRALAENDNRPASPFGVDCEKLAQTLSTPRWLFSESMRRICDIPRYSPRQVVHQFDVTFLTRIYAFPGEHLGGAFCSSQTEWRFLDGGIISHNGYGFGSHSWTVVEGMEATRAVCLFFGIKQARLIKGETVRRPLAKLLEDLSAVPLQQPRAFPPHAPWPTATGQGAESSTVV